MRILLPAVAAFVAVGSFGCFISGTGTGPDRANEQAYAGRWVGADNGLTLRIRLSTPVCDEKSSYGRFCYYDVSGTYEYRPPLGAQVTGGVSGRIFLEGGGSIFFDPLIDGALFANTDKLGPLSADKQSFSADWKSYRCLGCENVEPVVSWVAHTKFVREP